MKICMHQCMSKCELIWISVHFMSFSIQSKIIYTYVYKYTLGILGNLAII